MQIAIFKNIRTVIRAEKLCRENNLSITVIPLPEHLSSECGMCLQIDDNTDLFEILMQNHSIEIVYNDKI